MTGRIARAQLDTAPVFLFCSHSVKLCKLDKAQGDVGLTQRIVEFKGSRGRCLSLIMRCPEDISQSNISQGVAGVLFYGLLKVFSGSLLPFKTRTLEEIATFQ